MTRPFSLLVLIAPLLVGQSAVAAALQSAAPNVEPADPKLADGETQTPEGGKPAAEQASEFGADYDDHFLSKPRIYLEYVTRRPSAGGELVIGENVKLLGVSKEQVFFERSSDEGELRERWEEIAGMIGPDKDWMFDARAQGYEEFVALMKRGVFPVKYGLISHEQLLANRAARGLDRPKEAVQVTLPTPPAPPMSAPVQVAPAPVAAAAPAAAAGDGLPTWMKVAIGLGALFVIGLLVRR